MPRRLTLDTPPKGPLRAVRPRDLRWSARRGGPRGRTPERGVSVTVLTDRGAAVRTRSGTPTGRLTDRGHRDPPVAALPGPAPAGGRGAHRPPLDHALAPDRIPT